MKISVLIFCLGKPREATNQCSGYTHHYEKVPKELNSRK